MHIEGKGMTIYSDPYGGAAAFEGMKKADLILITDIHGDHLNLETLEALNVNETNIITCQAVADQLPATFTNVKVMGNGAKMEWQEIGLEAITMYNLPEDKTSRQTKGRGSDYVLTMGA